MVSETSAETQVSASHRNQDFNAVTDGFLVCCYVK